MKKTSISKIKSKLSKYLRFVKVGKSLSIREPITDLKTVLLKSEKRPFAGKLDILDILEQDREDRL